MVEEALIFVHHEIETRSIELSVQLDPDLPEVHGDRVQLQQVVVNLLINAVQALGQHEGGWIAQCTARGPDGTIRFAIRDDGPGIAPENLDRIFGSFFTTKADTSGTGLGLATVYAIVRQSGGTVTVDSRPGDGSRFTVTLPVASGPAISDAAPCQTALPEARDSRTTVLLAEDEASVREAARRLLQRAGVRVLTACNGVEALEVLNTDEHVDVLMTDMMMPVMGGAELITRAMAVRPALRVIVISGYTDISESEPHLLGDLILEKPFSATSLIRAVREVIAYPAPDAA